MPRSGRHMCCVHTHCRPSPSPSPQPSSRHDGPCAFWKGLSPQFLVVMETPLEIALKRNETSVFLAGHKKPSGKEHLGTCAHVYVCKRGWLGIPVPQERAPSLPACPWIWGALDSEAACAPQRRMRRARMAAGGEPEHWTGCKMVMHQNAHRSAFHQKEHPESH